MKQTAVEWFFEQLEFNESVSRYELLEQAKEMEKEQMKQLMWDLTEIDMKKSNKGLIIDNMFDAYWNETFKTE